MIPSYQNTKLDIRDDGKPYIVDKSIINITDRLEITITVFICVWLHFQVWRMNNP